MLENNLIGIGRVGSGRAKGLIEQSRSADGLNAKVTVAGFETETASIKINAIGLAGGGGQGLGKNATFRLKGGGVSRAGRAFGGRGNDAGASHGP